MRDAVFVDQYIPWLGGSRVLPPDALRRDTASANSASPIAAASVIIMCPASAAGSVGKLIGGSLMSMRLLLQYLGQNPIGALESRLLALHLANALAETIA